MCAGQVEAEPTDEGDSAGQGNVGAQTVERDLPIAALSIVKGRRSLDRAVPQCAAQIDDSRYDERRVRSGLQ